MIRTLILLILILHSGDSFAQDTLWIDESKYVDSGERITLYYHRNGVLAKRTINGIGARYKITSWDEEGKKTGKSKWGKTLFRRIRKHKTKQYTFHENGQLMRYRISKGKGCKIIIKNKVKEFDTEGKLVAKEK